MSVTVLRSLEKEVAPVTRLSIAPKLQRFDVISSESAENDFVDVLRRNNESTSNIIVTRPEDLFLDSKAKVQGRFTMSTIALASLCSRLVPGLSQTAANIAGDSLTDAELEASNEHSSAVAVDWINAAIKLRFRRVRGFTLVVDREQKRVEGVVGRKYAFVSNLELYSRAKEFANKSNRKVVFSDAALVGRRMALRFRDIKPLFTSTDDTYFAGFHFANSETGDCSVRASAMIIRQRGNTKSLSEFSDGGKIAHVKGRTFGTRLTELLTGLTFTAKDIQKYKTAICDMLIRTNLNCGGTESHHDSRVKSIINQLRLAGLGTEVAAAVVKHALVYGSCKTDRLTAQDNPLDKFKTRTAFDIYNAITYRAKLLDIDSQEKAEQIAFRMLSGKVVLH